MEVSPEGVNKLQWDQSKFTGRLNYFIRITNPLLSLKSNNQLDEAAGLVHSAKRGKLPDGITQHQLQQARIIYDSAFHPDTGEKMNLIGRMSFQVPGGMLILGAMLVYYRTALQVFGIQWINQSFNALVNYTNRNANSQITNKQILTAYVGATAGAVSVSIALNSLVKRAPLIVAKWVPFVAVAAANCINIPVMRQRELVEGIAVSSQPSTSSCKSEELGKSRIAAIKGIGQVAISRVSMTIPTLLFLPVVMTKLEMKYPILIRSNFVSVGVQTLFCGILLCFAVPMGCSLFPQQRYAICDTISCKCVVSSIKFKQLEEQVQDEIKDKLKGQPLPNRVYFNKGL